MERGVRFLADSHALLWWLTGVDRLSPAAMRAFADGETEVYVSAASAWEICTKHRIGKLPQAAALAADFERSVASRGFLLLSVTVAHGERAGQMQDPHKDPFDRMLIAQALLNDLTLISNEAVFDRFGVRRLW